MAHHTLPAETPAMCGGMTKAEAINPHGATTQADTQIFKKQDEGTMTDTSSMYS